MMTQKLGNGFEFIKKACFVCGSFNHLIKDCDFHDNKMVEKPVLNNKGRVTGQREIRPVWNNAQRVNHQNKLTHPHPKRKFVPTVVLTKSGQVPVNAVKQSSPRATTSISTARPVNTAAPKSKVNDALPKTYSYFKAHSPVRRAFNQKSAAKTNNLNEKVKTAKVNNVTTVGPKAVVSAAKGNGENAIIKRLMVDLLHLEEVLKEVKLLEKKNSVLFTETECLVLSPDFKLLDESQVLLKVPRQNNMYSFNLKNVVPSGGSGPDWLFDIDLLTNSLNYKLATAGNQTNRNEGIKDNVDAVPTQQYILLPLLSDSPQSSGDAVADDTTELDKLLVQQKEGYANSTNRDSTVSPSISAAGKSFVNGDDLPTDPLMPNLEDTTDLLNTNIFSGAYDDEDVGAEADLNNLEITMNVSPIPTTRIHKDHSKDQIIGDINSATQTRRMTKISKEHAMIEAMQKELLQFKLQKVWTLVDLPKGYTQEEEIDYDEVYKVEKALYGLHQAPRAWYETLSTYLLENRLRIGTIDKTLFIKKDKGDILLVQVYVEDIFFGSTKKSLCVEFEQMMHKRFQMSSIGELTFFLGLQVKQKDDGIFISQDKYVADI
ncbi:putative ribonuclease H-like domain-containing protein [Tanacetum coccineum]